MSVVRMSILAACGFTPFFAKSGEEHLEQCTRLFCHHTRGYEELMVEAWVVVKAHQRTAGTRLGIISGVNDTFDAGEHQRAGAHGAGLEGDIESDTVQPFVSEGVRGGGDRLHLGVRGGIMERFDAVASFAEELSLTHRDRTHRHLTLFGGFGGEPQRHTHVKTIDVEQRFLTNFFHEPQQ